ncbi:DUF4244 domain-containing protein [Arthrobacter sp. Alg241-R88]|uniref:DUF4244 domain-containing protein n=1 Tax=Arthrobacter sp. Alg241-R88 TaxID=2305984 RepID=UPI0013D3C48C|nr:DUF4244 domain-containing protein [Arthrobacter sp. Alg241-R88]
MSINQDRHYAAGAAALTASRANPKRRLSGRQPAYSRRAGAVGLPANVVELYPGATLPRHRSGVRRLMGSEAGMATAEYAITTLAAVGFAGLLVFILRSEEVRGFLLNLIRTALALP